jgi:hypothetical protein
MPQFEYDTLAFESGLVLVRKFHGKVNVEKIISSWNYLINNNLLTEKHLGVVNDLRDATLEMNTNCFQELINYMKENPIFLKLKLAVVCDTPEKIVFPTLGEYTVKELWIKPFSTFEAAVEWVMI